MPKIRDIMEKILNKIIQEEKIVLQIKLMKKMWKSQIKFKKMFVETYYSCKQQIIEEYNKYNTIFTDGWSESVDNDKNGWIKAKNSLDSIEKNTKNCIGTNNGNSKLI